MDQNKTLKLVEIGYTIKPSCALCIFSCFPQNDWGLCERHTYEHRKHDGTHQLSVHKTGSCAEFAPDYAELSTMQHYREFFRVSLRGKS